jgi:hypothetical protein
LMAEFFFKILLLYFLLIVPDQWHKMNYKLYTCYQ